MSNYNANLIANKADIENVVYIFGLEVSKYRSLVSNSAVLRYSSLYRDNPYQYTYSMATCMLFEAAGSQAKGEMIGLADILSVLLPNLPIR